MAAHHRLRLAVLSAFALLASTARAADAAYIQIPGVPGTSTAVGRTDWNDVAEYTLNVAPGVLSADKKSVFNQCTLTVDARFGAGAATVAALVGAPAGEVHLELDKVGGDGAGITYERATLSNAVITQDVSAFAAGTLGPDRLVIRFDAVKLAITAFKADGSPGGTTEGTFTCTTPAK